MQKLIKPLIQKNNSRIVLVVLDGLGGLPLNGRTELETARTPNLDALAARSACGLHVPVAYGITPGSGPGHLGLFGYDPVEYRIGRGVLEALGLGLEVRRTDISVRCNYATLRDEVITDRRAERIPTEQSKRLTPSVMKGHSWHPVPLLLSSPYVLGRLCASFSERECVRGELGIFPAVNILPLALANAGRLKKFGA